MNGPLSGHGGRQSINLIQLQTTFRFDLSFCGGLSGLKEQINNWAISLFYFTKHTGLIGSKSFHNYAFKGCTYFFENFEIVASSTDKNTFLMAIIIKLTTLSISPYTTNKEILVVEEKHWKVWGFVIWHLPISKDSKIDKRAVTNEKWVSHQVRVNWLDGRGTLISLLLHE
jgi:hypothetical protein